MFHLDTALLPLEWEHRIQMERKWASTKAHGVSLSYREAILEIPAKHMAAGMEVPMKFQPNAPCRRYQYVTVFAIFCLLLVPPKPVYGQHVIATVPVGQSPWDVAVNPSTDKIYVTNQEDGTVTVIDAHNNKTTTISDPSLYLCAGLAVNPATNKIYVTSEGSSANGFGDGHIAVIDGATNTVTQLSEGGVPGNVVVNPATNKIYVENYDSAGPYLFLFTPSITVIDGATNSLTTLPDMSNGYPKLSDLVVNPITNKIYAGSSSSIEVIDGATNAVTMIPGGTGDVLALNQATNKLYAGMTNGGDIQVINAATNSVAAGIPASNFYQAAANPVTNRVYFTHILPDLMSAGYVEVVNGATNATTIFQDLNALAPGAIALNSKTNKIYVANRDSNNITVIDGATNATTTVSNPNTYQPYAVAVNPKTNRIYVVNRLSNDVTVILDESYDHRTAGH